MNPLPTDSKPITNQRPQLPLKQLTMLLIVFAAGGFLGATVATKTIHSRIQQFRQHPETLREKIVLRLQEKLDLNDDQTKNIRDIFYHRHASIVTIRSLADVEARLEFDKMEEEISAILDANQAHNWRELADEVRRKYLPPQTALGN